MKWIANINYPELFVPHTHDAIVITKRSTMQLFIMEFCDYLKISFYVTRRMHNMTNIYTILGITSFGLVQYNS